MIWTSRSSKPPPNSMSSIRNSPSKHFALNMVLMAVAVISASLLLACEDFDVQDSNQIDVAPTIERAPTIETAPTIAAAPTVERFAGFEQAPTAETFEGFEQAPTAETFEGFNQAPTVTQFEGFNDADDPCSKFLEDPSPYRAEEAAKWAMGQLDGAGGEIDPNDPLRLTAACNAALSLTP